jgi:hypothetical protein
MSKPDLLGVKHGMAAEELAIVRRDGTVSSIRGHPLGDGIMARRFKGTHL